MSEGQARQQQRHQAGGEWPTWMLIFVVYTSWWICLSYYEQVGPLMGLALMLVCALHSSVQHELLHGHPTSSVLLNGLLAYPPLALLFPYPHYRTTHIAHHNKEILTIPGVDPESCYISQSEWQNSQPLFRLYFTFYKTALGRLLMGPAHSLVLLGQEMIQDFSAGRLKESLMWFTHIVLITLILTGVSTYFNVPLWHYLIIAYFANSMVMIRSFFEHRAAENGDHRSVIVETGLFFRILFLNNNYHYLHHKFPDAPWYQLSGMYQQNRDVVLKENGGFLVRGYKEWLIDHLLKPIDSPVHPFSDVRRNN